MKNTDNHFRETAKKLVESNHLIWTNGESNPGPLPSGSSRSEG